MTRNTYALDDKVAIITGSANGIGERTAKRLAKEGAAVVICDREAKAGNAVAEEIRGDGGEAIFVCADQARPEAIEKVIERTIDSFKRIDVLVNNAAINIHRPVKEATLEDWQRIVDVNLRAYWLFAKHAIDHIPSGGCIVNISSIHAAVTTPTSFPYNALKPGVEGMTRAMAIDFGRDGVRVNAIRPGRIVPEEADDRSTSEAHKEAKKYPIGRLGNPDDIANTVAFLSTEDASFITGTVLTVDGGRSTVERDEELVDFATTHRHDDPN